ncbi:MAG: hypothetical protein GTO02_05010 [Candidatus Dadabacteria bacterium]|nr:hypothetical protein [Candidatus Dadabacteria bacterium]NIQ13770.1 hypothetical protein [Candidatus Dadabacteria bacterium]
MPNNKVKLFAICLCFISFIISSNLHTHDSFDYSYNTDAVDYTCTDSHETHFFCSACLFSQNNKFGHVNFETIQLTFVESDETAINWKLSYKNLLPSLNLSRAPPVVVFS